LTVAQSVPEEQKNEVRDYLIGTISNTLSYGGNVYLVEYFGDYSNPIWDNWITPYTGIVPSDLIVFNLKVGWVFDGEIVWIINPTK
jgi:hypothetical protein